MPLEEIAMMVDNSEEMQEEILESVLALAHEVWEFGEGYGDKGPHCLLPRRTSKPSPVYWKLYDEAVRRLRIGL